MAAGTRLLVILAACWSLVGAVPATAATPVAAPGVEIQLLDAPTKARDNPRARVYIVDQVTPGTVITRHVRVTNRASAPAAVSLYTGAASVSGGRFEFADARTPDELTSWSSLSTSTATLAAGAHVDVTVLITVPANASGGERYAVIWAQLASAATASGAREVNRVGVRIYLDVAGTTAVQPSDFAISRITARRDAVGHPVLTVLVTNTGVRAVDISGTVALTDGPGHVGVGPVPLTAQITIGPADSQPTGAVFDAALATGPWLATVDLVSGLVHHRASARVSFTAEGVAAPVVPSPTDHASPSGGRLPWWAIAAALTVLAALTLVAARRRSGPVRS